MLKADPDPGYGADLDAYAALRSTETSVVVLEPSPDTQLDALRAAAVY